MNYDGIRWPGSPDGDESPGLRSYRRRVVLGDRVTQTDVAWFWSQVAQAALQKAVWRGTVALNAGWPLKEER